MQYRFLFENRLNASKATLHLNCPVIKNLIIVNHIFIHICMLSQTYKNAFEAMQVSHTEPDVRLTELVCN